MSNTSCPALARACAAKPPPMPAPMIATSHSRCSCCEFDRGNPDLSGPKHNIAQPPTSGPMEGSSAVDYPSNSVVPMTLPKRYSATPTPKPRGISSRTVQLNSILRDYFQLPGKHILPFTWPPPGTNGYRVRVTRLHKQKPNGYLALESRATTLIGCDMVTNVTGGALSSPELNMSPVKI